MNESVISYDVIVVGGGASGMMAAGRAAEMGKKVLLIEKNKELGKKLKITGGGRCNITNAEHDTHILLSNYGDARDFLHSAFSKFGVGDTFSFFESRGLKLKIEDRKRAFPATEKAQDVFDLLLKYLEAGGVEIMKGEKVEEILAEGDEILGVVVAGKTLSARSYILSTGGKSHPETGSTGDGFEWLRLMEHAVSQPTPTIVPITVKEEWVKKLAGMTLRDIRISFRVNDIHKLSLKGDVLCTHFGLSGPLILNAASDIKDLLEEGEVVAKIDTYPQLDHGTLDKRVLDIFNDNKNKSLKNVFNLIGPVGSSYAILPLAKIDPDKKVHSITTEERKGLVHTLKELTITVNGLLGYEKAVITDGGVSLTDIDMRTMRSKKYLNLYVTGDLLDIRRPSGGYSLQLCWTTGFIAGTEAASTF